MPLNAGYGMLIHTKSRRTMIKDYEFRKLHEPLSQQITRELVNLLTRKPIKLHKPLSQQITCKLVN